MSVPRLGEYWDAVLVRRAFSSKGAKTLCNQGDYEVTPEMVDAGRLVLKNNGVGLGDAIITDIYRAMNAKVQPAKDEWMRNPLVNDERDPEPYDS